MKKIIAVLSFAFIVTGCGEDKWELFIYPQGDNFSFSMNGNISPFKSLESCRNAANEYMYQQSIKGNSLASYSCGLNCKYREGINPQGMRFLGQLKCDKITQ